MRHLRLLPLSLLLIASCKEVGPYIDLGPKAADTAFMAAVETPQQRIVLIEEFTGVTCPTCPPAHKVLKTIEDQYTGKVAIVGIQPVGNAQSKPYAEKNGVKTIHDNRSQEGTDLAEAIYGTTSSIPVAGFDRVPQGGVMRPNRTEWLNFMPNRVNVPTLANVKMESSYNASNKQAVIKVHIAYTSAVAMAQYLTVALVENDVVDAQELPLGDTAEAAGNYVHQHVLRDIITPPVGVAILSDKATKAAGQVYERTFVYTLPDNVLNPDNCHLIAFVSNNDGTNKEILQAAETHLK